MGIDLQKELIVKTVNESFSKNQVREKLGLANNGSNIRKIQSWIDLYDISTDHFDLSYNRRKYKVITKICPVCSNKFETKEGSKYEKTVCSHSCANVYFRSGEDNPNWKDGSNKTYRKICFRYHEHKCVYCDEILILDVHHMDGDRTNQDPVNLIPLCATHHRYWHSKHRHLIRDKVLKYIKTFISKSI